MVSFCAILFFYVYQHIQALRYGYEVEEKYREESLLRMENDAILMEIKRYTSLPRLEQLAKEKLGLKIADKQEIVVLLQAPEDNTQETGKAFLKKAISQFRLKRKHK